MKCVRLAIQGRVQGVSFRESARREAERLGVRGWVRNERDGTVTAHLEGPAAAVDCLVAWCGHGPAGARVEWVESQAAEPGGHAEFRVLR